MLFAVGMFHRLGQRHHHRKGGSGANHRDSGRSTHLGDHSGFLATAGRATPWGALPGMKGDKPKQEESNPSVKADDKAYKSALEAIPTKPKQAYDPWHNVRAAPPNNSK